MFDPRQNVTDFIRERIKTPEGMLLSAMMAVYFLLFLFFDFVVPIVKSLDGNMTEDFKLGFLIMPLALIATYLSMESTARGGGDRILGVFVLLFAGALPFLKIFNILF